jgi:hypothetical protein
MAYDTTSTANASREIRLHETAEKGLMSALTRLEDSIGRLAHRVEPVAARVDNPKGAAVQSVPSNLVDSSSELAAVFNQVHLRLDILVRKLDEVTARIEL